MNAWRTIVNTRYNERIYTIWLFFLQCGITETDRYTQVNTHTHTQTNQKPIRSALFRCVLVWLWHSRAQHNTHSHIDSAPPRTTHQTVGRGRARFIRFGFLVWVCLNEHTVRADQFAFNTRQVDTCATPTNTAVSRSRGALTNTYYIHAQAQ